METKNIIYREDIKNVDNETGEIKTISTRKLSKVPRTPDFVMLYTKHIAFLEHLNKAETTILFEILSKYVGVENIILLSPAIKKSIVKKINVDASYINRAIRGLKNKKVIIENEESILYLNPMFFGKGNWEDIHKLRHEIAYDFDFKTLEVKETRNLKTVYESGFDIDNHKVVEELEYKDDNGVQVQEIVVKEKEENKNNPKQQLINFNGIEQQEVEKNELEILKEQNRSKELDLEEKKLAVEEMKLKLKMHELGLV